MTMRRLTAVLVGVLGLFAIVAAGCSETKPEEGASASPAAGAETSKMSDTKTP